MELIKNKKKNANKLTQGTKEFCIFQISKELHISIFVCIIYDRQEMENRNN